MDYVCDNMNIEIRILKKEQTCSKHLILSPGTITKVVMTPAIAPELTFCTIVISCPDRG